MLAYPLSTRTCSTRETGKPSPQSSKYYEDLTVGSATTLIKGEDGEKYNLLWLLCRNREGPGGRGEMDMNNFPLLDAEAHRNCDSKLYAQL